VFDLLSPFLFILSIASLVVTALLMLKRRIRKVRVKVPFQPPTVAGVARMVRRMTLASLVAMVGIFVAMLSPLALTMRNPLVLIGCVLLAITGLTLYVRVGLENARHCYGP
jgi:hypothetical protein